MTKLHGVALITVILLSACDDKAPNDKPSEEVVSDPVKKTGWKNIQQQRQLQLEAYLKQEQAAYSWFADFPMGINDGVPYIILKLLPKLAPELWGSDENFLDVIGLFKDQRAPGYPIARGIGWSGLGRDDPNGAVDYASFTCGACHIGQVRTNEGIRYLDGGINAQFNLPQYRVRAMKTVEKIAGNVDGEQNKIDRATSAIIATLDQMHAEDKNYFYQNYKLGGKVFDAEYESQQIVLFKQNAPAIIKKFIARTQLEYSAFAALLNQNYRGFESQMLDGFGGMADATGISTSFNYVVRRDVDKDPSVNPETDLPPTQSITDFMPVWEQDKRKVHWSADHTQLLDGGGQWNGNIPIPMFRDLAAELTMGFGAETDLRVSAFAETLLENLPAPVYPFNVDMDKADKGRDLYQQNCTVCHKPHNGEVYQIGTHNGRARVATEAITEGARVAFTTICSPETTIEMPGQGSIKPCAQFEGVSLAGKAEFAMMNPAQHDGYNALPLGGVWAQAPYLHNGSVPTIYHLLVPDERPVVFMKSRLDYDQQFLGFSWMITANKQDTKEEGYQYDTQAIPAFSNAGHDKDITIGQQRYKLNWNDDKEGAMAIIEYMKTL
ncbi:MAG: cytochrome C [Methylicorpusculum sp.]|uniref:c-type cytochrome n=1 Tax=Methylicorpusculum sp. TaxID=2713644 RepID=UPI00271CE0A8|nr:cytochrome C [Methylicorpusculum sp.]MDO8939164.1 cytochrome C [Methylicorpusculum sp.]MDP2201501.1 cytochrome C [Methylicorpusculum sp.]